MIIAFICLIFIILSFNFSVITFQVNGINRAVIGTPVAIFESSIVMDENYPKFNKEFLESKLTYYYDTTLSKYTNEYSISYMYFTGKMYAICMTDSCREIEIDVKAKIAFNYEIFRRMNYTIRSNYE